MKSTVTPSKSAVPFWFIDAPAVSTKRATLGGSRRFSSATLSAVGSVAFEDAVENAVIAAIRTSRKNCTGFRPPKNRTESE